MARFFLYLPSLQCLPSWPGCQCTGHFILVPRGFGPWFLPPHLRPQISNYIRVQVGFMFSRHCLNCFFRSFY
jgi:hypothetical protein